MLNKTNKQRTAKSVDLNFAEKICLEYPRGAEEFYKGQKKGWLSFVLHLQPMEGADGGELRAVQDVRGVVRHRHRPGRGGGGHRRRHRALADERLWGELTQYNI